MNIVFGVLFLATLALGIPVAFCLALTSLVALLIIGDVPLILIPQRMFTGIDSFPLMAVPFFIMAGDLMNRSGITDRIIRFSTALVGSIRGGLAHVNVVASMFFAGLSGSAVADTAALGSIMIPAMEEDGYDLSFSAAVTAASSVIGPDHPAEHSGHRLCPDRVGIGGRPLFGRRGSGPAGRPGADVRFLFHLPPQGVWIQAAPGFAGGIFNQPERGDSALLMPIIIMGGILSGVFTPTEAASVAVAYALLVGIFVLKTLKLKDLSEIFFQIDGHHLDHFHGDCLRQHLLLAARHPADSPGAWPRPSPPGPTARICCCCSST